MAKFTQIILKSKEKDRYGFPEKFSVYHLAEPIPFGGKFFHVPVLAVRENDYRIPYPQPVEAKSQDDARDKVIKHFRDEAAKRKLEVQTFDLPNVK